MEELSLTAIESHTLGHPTIPEVKLCLWKVDDGLLEIFETGCGGSFHFSDGTPTENKFLFCPFCGGKISVQQP